MYAYIIIGVIALLSPVIGYFLGAVRTFTCLVGAIVGVFTAPMLAEQLQSLLPKLKINDPFWQDFFGPGIAYLIILLVFFGIGFAVHIVPSNYYRMRRDEITRLRWIKVMQKSGIVVGLVTGLTVLISTSHLVSAFGYPATLFPGSSPKGFKELTETREGFEKVGLSEISGGFDSTPDQFYELLEAVSLVYNNSDPSIRYRLSAYPPFINKLNNDSFYKSIANDSGLKTIFDKKGSFTDLYANKNVQEALQNMPIYEELKNIDLEDMKKFIESGVSEKYKRERIVGRWQLDQGQTTREVLTDISKVSDSIRAVVRKAIKDVEVSFVATLDGKFTSKINIPEGKIQFYLAQQAAGNQGGVNRVRVRIPNQDNGNNDFNDSYNSQMSDAYGQGFQGGGGGGRGGNGRGNANVQNSESFNANQQAQLQAMAARMNQNKGSGPNPSTEIRKIMTALSSNTSGTWTKTTRGFSLKFKNGARLEAVVLDGDLKVLAGNKTYIFYPDL